ncbi:arginine--tRNA ligase [Zongyangia hominis]|uniref:Arginine--tRNA ligase n=1 Tax=Zongyangia hominis TaxID=2763677 RepID=A0A926IC94_9FIRM|nr:arginine--tRNA ligase [Zongyangia hominis]MBC8570977.1 arginine--tRNA ligase [Zongyangia hominis]
MANLVKEAKDQLKEVILNAMGMAVADGQLEPVPLPPFTIEIPNDTSHGDFAANVAMVCAKALKKNPRQIASVLMERMIFDGTYFERCEVAGPGFLNFFLSKRWFAKVIKAIETDGENYGRSDEGGHKKVMVEFVSANPTGPMHMGNARGGALGDCLAAVLDWAGCDVTREFYVNDAGNQIEKFAGSLEARYLQIYKGEDAVPFPEDGYHGEDIKVRAKEFAALHGDAFVEAGSKERREALVDYALPKNIKGLRTDLAKYRIEYDVWFRESVLHESGAIDDVVKTLSDKGLTYEKDGAVWYKATSYGGEKDEVLIRANGNPTYFAADIAYHYNKFAVRGFDKVINVWGADHHGHVARLKGAMDAIGLDGNKLDIVLMQLVRLTRDGEVVRMSKRTGKAITLTDLIDEVPIDAARFLFNMREPGSQMEFDLGLAVEQSSQNPVYYVQYAHARICSILKNLAAEGIAPAARSLDELLCFEAPEEIELIRYLSIYPNEILESAKTYDPARITRYVIELANKFHKFYNACRVKGEAENVMQARLALCLAVRTVIRNVLTMLKINVPDTM